MMISINSKEKHLIVVRVSKEHALILLISITKFRGTVQLNLLPPAGITGTKMRRTWSAGKLRIKSKKGVSLSGSPKKSGLKYDLR